jgi:hypothetical protein
MLFGPVTEQLNFERSGKDNTGLGMWTVMTLQGDGVQTRIVCSYNPCRNSKLNSGTSYQQHCQYFITQKMICHAQKNNFAKISLNNWGNGDRTETDSLFALTLTRMYIKIDRKDTYE